MKNKCLLLIFVLVILASSTYAETTGVLPVITADFAEEVVVINAFFYNNDYFKSYNAITVDNINNKRFSFKPEKALDNGNYKFVLTARDLVGNTKEYSHTFDVFEAETDIKLTLPNPLGYSKSTPFDVGIFTSKVSSCKYSGVPVDDYNDLRLKLFDETGNTTSGILESDHLIKGMAVPPDFPKRLYVVCKDSLGRDVPKAFTLHTDPNPPTIAHLSFSPNPVAEYPETGPLSSLLTVNADEPVICKYTQNPNTTYEGMKSFPIFDRTDITTFRDVQEVLMVYDDNIVKDSFDYYVQCEDRAGHLSTKKSITLTIDLTLGLSINVVTPAKSSRNTSVFLNITTNKRSYCMYKGSSPDPGSFTDPSAALSSDIDNLARHHWKDLGTRGSGNHTVQILCMVPEGVGVEAQEGQLTYRFVIDTNPPTTPEVSALTPVCGNTLTANFNASDLESGIDHYEWAVGGAGTIYNAGNTSEDSVSVSEYASGEGFNLSGDLTYSFSVVAVDKAGNKGAAGASNTITFDSTGISCDYSAPIVTLSKSLTGDSVTIDCEDDKSGCSSLGSFYGTSYEDSCQANQYYLPPVTIPLFKSTIICYNISDVAGNRAVGSKLMDLNTSELSADTIACTGGIDSDGDGYGERCPLGADCDDTDPNISIGCANGCIMDLDGDGYGIGCTAGNDCNGRDASLTTSCPNNCLSDNDGDEYGLGCKNGPDCAGDDSTLTTQCPNGCMDDNDGDGYGINCPAGFDCQGEDLNKLVSCDPVCLQDTDGDGYGIGCTNGLDCAGNDPLQTTGCSNGCVFDEDGDGYGLGCANGNDCSGLHLFLFESCPNNCIVDNDGDTYGWGCDLGADCDDTDPTINLDCTATTNCIYDHDGDGYGLGCANGPDCNDFNWDTLDDVCDANCTFDEDCNGLPDFWQMQYFNNSVCSELETCGRDGDPDGDSLTNIQEYRRSSDPLVKEELQLPPPVEETKEDADEDGMPDACEVSYGLNPSDPFDAEKDNDADGLNNRYECTYTSGACSDTWLNPNNKDTDFDGYTDDAEIDQGFDPCDPEDHPSKSMIWLILFILGLIMILGSVGYLIYKRYYIPLISPPSSPKPAVTTAAKVPRPGAHPAPGHLAPKSSMHHIPHRFPHHRAKPKPSGPLMSRDKFLEESKRRAAAREKLFSKFGAKHEHKAEETMKHLAKNKRTVRHIPIHHRTHPSVATKAVPHKKPAPASTHKDHVEHLTKIIGPDYFDRISDLSKKEGDYFGKLATIVKKKEIPLESQYVDKLAKISKEMKKDDEIKPKEVEKAFKKTDVDKLDEFLDSRKKVSTFLREYAKEEVEVEKTGSTLQSRKQDDFARLESIGVGKKVDFDSLESLSKKKREDVIGNLEELGTKKAKETALSKMTELSDADSKEEIFKTFKKISREKHVDKDVFAVLLDYMFKSGKISKHDVSELLFKLEEDGVLDKKDISDVFFRLGMNKNR